MDVLSNIQDGLNSAFSATKTVFESAENVQYVDKGIVGTKRLMEGLSVQTGLDQLTKATGAIGAAELFINAGLIFSFGTNFGRPKQPEDVPIKLVNDNGTVKQDRTKHDRKVGTTPFLYDLKYKPQRAIATAGFFAATVTSVVSLLEAFKIPVLSAIEKGIGMIPVIGQTIGSGFVSNFFAVGGIALMTARVGLLFDSIQYLYLCTQDSSKSLTKGLLQLAARVASLVLDLLFVLNVGNPIVLGIAGITTCVLGLASILYCWQRSKQKEQNQIELLALGQKQNSAREAERVIEQKLQLQTV